MNCLPLTPLVAGALLASCATPGSAPPASAVATEPAMTATSSEPSTGAPAAEAPRATLAAWTAPEPLLAPVQDGNENYGPQAEGWELMLGGSGGNDKDFDVGGGSMSGSLGYFFDERQELGLRQDLRFSDFGNSVWNGSTRIFFDYHFGDDAVRPLIGLNFGWVYGDTVDETLAAAPEVGVKWYLVPNAFLFALAEYQFFFEDTKDADDAFEDGQFVYSIGIGMNL